MLQHLSVCVLALSLALTPVVELAAQQPAQQTGSIGVVVTDRQSGDPIANAQVSVAGTQLGAITDQNGRALIRQVPVGSHTVRVSLLGYSDARQTDVQVEAGGVASVSLAVEQSVLALAGITVSATTDPVEGVKMPMTVGTVGTDQLQVPATNSALAAMQGRVAGANIIRASGQPGTGVYIQLRSLTGFESDASPLIVVDGVILARSFSGTTADIESMDIESIEVIKGAAAASLYGSRAAAGVVSITTNRGRGLPAGETRFQYRSEMGRDVLGGRIPLALSHHYLMNEDGTRLINAEGRDTTWAGRTPKPDRIADLGYPGQAFDNLAALYRPGLYLQQNFSMSQNTESTTFTTSIARLDQSGALENNKGFDRTTARVTLDHRVGEMVNISMVGTHVRSFRDVVSGNPYTAILTYPAFVDLTARDEDGNFLMVPDPSVEIENPLWRQASRDNNETRARTLGSANMRVVPANWITFEGQASYDRSDINSQVYVPMGVPISAFDESIASGGRLDLFHRRTDSFNAWFGATLRQQLGDLNLRLATRALTERERSDWFRADGRDFVVPGVPDLDVAANMETIGSGITEIRSNGFLVDLGLDFRDRYIMTAMVRRDGSSLFGPRQRWQTYTRLAGAYRMSQEEWFNVPFIDEFKLRYAMGEAGGRPGFSNQYELWNVTRAGGVTRGNQGNPNLRPQFTREQEVGLDVIGFNNRAEMSLVYAHQTSRDQIIYLPAITMTGFNSVLGNGATIQGKTLEAEFRAWPVRTRDVTWNMSLVLDQSRNEITSWDRACFFGSNAGRTHEFTCEGESAGDFWVQTLTQSHDQLPSWVQDRADEFVINDDGYLVWVGVNQVDGTPNSWQDGLTENCREGGTCWGTLFSAGGQTYRWGEPFRVLDEDGQPVRINAGSSLPDLNFGFTNNITFRGFTVFAAFRGQIGGKVYNNVRQWMYGSLRHGDFDQRGKPDGEKKTVDYYQRGIYNGYAWTDIYLEDGSHLKLGELSVRYRFNQSQLQRVLGPLAPTNLGVGVNGRNLFTLTNYSGFDPEAGTQFSRVENIRYPHLRTFTATFDVTF